MKAYGLTQYHQVTTNTAYFPVILHFLHHRCVCMHNAHTSSLFRHSTAFLLRAPALAGGSCQYPSFPLLAISNFVFDLGKRLSADNTLGTSGKAQKHVFRPRGDQFVETNYVTPNEQAGLILSLAVLCVTALEDIKTV